MTGNISILPVWKKGATAYERLSELTLLAQDHPERFESFVLVYREVAEDETWKIRTMEFGGRLDIYLGLLDLGKDRIMKDSEV